jgi:hypothetical protein
MKKVITACLATALFVPAIAIAQNSSQQPNDKNLDQQQQNQSAMSNQMGVTTRPKQTMSGSVTNDGKTFTSDNKSYIVNNPKALKNYDNQSVSVVFQFNSDNNSIHILSVSPAQP